MSIRVSRFTLFSIIALTCVALGLAGDMSITNGDMQSSAAGLTGLAFLSVVTAFWPRPVLPADRSRHVGKMRRYLGAMIDLCIAMAWGLLATFTLTYIIEWLATGTWQWSWERDTLLARDLILVPLIIFCYIGIYQYFLQHLKRGRTTVGQFLLGYRIVALDNVKWHKRLIQGFLAIWIWPVGLFARQKEPGAYFWDIASNSRAVSTRAE